MSLLDDRFSKETLDAIALRDGWVCVYCGNLADAVDYVVPKRKGGPSITANGVCCCDECYGRNRQGMKRSYLQKAIFHLLMRGEDMSWLHLLNRGRLREYDPG